MPGTILLLLSVGFVVAGVAKLAAPERFRATLRKLMPAGAARLAGTGVPILELLLAAWLVSGIAPRHAAATAMLVLLAFSIMLRKMWRRGLSCGCFGEVADSAPSGLARNAILIALAACVALPATFDANDSPWAGGPTLVLGRFTIVLGAACLWPCLVALLQRRQNLPAHGAGGVQ
jgi:uncharacterized membrane protein YphA (DoxX/SURF4 family)